MKTAKKKITAEEFDSRFDAGEDMSEYLDRAKGRKYTPDRSNETSKMINVSCPEWMVQELDKEADRIGVPRQSIIKIWLDERLAQQRTHAH